jgi:chromate transporter
MALPEKPPIDPPASPFVTPHVPLHTLYRTFFWVGLFSFGGGLSGWLHREIVSTRGWMTEDQFFSGYSLSQVIPGVNASNLTVYIGQHLRGMAGAAVALAGLLSGPVVVVILAAVTYQYLLQVPGFQAAMAGVAAAAIGMLIRLALMAARRATTAVVPTLILLGVFIAVGFLRWPLVYVALVAAPISVAYAWFTRDKADA